MTMRLLNLQTSNAKSLSLPSCATDWLITVDFSVLHHSTFFDYFDAS